MGVSPVRFAVAVSGAVACLMLGLVAGVRAGTNETAHLVSVETVTHTVAGDVRAAVARTVILDGRVRTETQHVLGADAAARTLTETATRTVHDPVTVTETQTVQRAAPAGATPKPDPKPKPKPKPDPEPKPPGADDGGGDAG
jgi:outer membrane biosynthesis protein TonB